MDRFEIIVEAARDAIVCANERGKITYLNPAAIELFGYTSDEALGADLTLLMPARYRRAHREGLKRFIRSGKSRLIGKIVEMTGLQKSGEEFPVELSLAQRRAGGELEVVGVIRDITLRKQLQQRLEYQASTDYLTGLWNRHAFDKKLEEEWQRARRYKKPLVVFMADLDHFKEFNDIYGHQAGDMALKAIAAIMLTNVRSTDLIARYGGEELAAVLPETNHTRAEALAQRILIAVQNLGIKHSGFPKTGLLTVSIGLSELSPDDSTSYDLVRRADTALYQAKHLGRNRVSTDADVKKESGTILKQVTKHPKDEVLS